MGFMVDWMWLNRIWDKGNGTQFKNTSIKMKGLEVMVDKKVKMVFAHS